MADYSWKLGDELGKQEVPSACRPVRFALTAPQCIIRGGRELLLIDPHPAGTWMNWMLPYASLVPTLEELESKLPGATSQLEIVRTFDELSEFLRTVRSRLLDDYRGNIVQEVNNVLPQISKGWDGESFFENYSLKFSKTADAYTAYVFEYYRMDVNQLSVQLPHIWVPLDGASAWLADASHLEGRTVSSNVDDLLEAGVI